MNETSRPISTVQQLDPDQQADLLMSRMIDGVADPEDDLAFARAADARPQLWRELALRQRDAAMLSAAVESRLSRVEDVPLPRAAAQTTPGRETIPFPVAARRHANWLFAAAGWAAAIAMVLVWRLASPGGFHDHAASNIQNAAQMSPDEQLRSYLKAPYVIGELNPLMERVDTLPDGRNAVLLQRRIQEVVFLQENDPLPVDDERFFTKDPAELRGERQ